MSRKRKRKDDDDFWCAMCRRAFQTLANFEKHKCPSGYCDGCGLFLLHLRVHTCAVERFARPLTEECVREFVDSCSLRCEECRKLHFVKRTSFRVWRGRDECVDCYRRHQPEMDAMWVLIRRWQIERSLVDCARCERALVRVAEDGDAAHATVLLNHQFDHVDFWDKNNSICTMVWRGEPWQSIEEELGKCQVLCHACHSIVTAAELVCGFHSLKKVDSKTDQHIADAIAGEGKGEEGEVGSKTNKEYAEMLETRRARWKAKAIREYKIRLDAAIELLSRHVNTDDIANSE